VALSATSTSSFATPQQTWRTRMTTLSADTLRTLFLRTACTRWKPSLLGERVDVASTAHNAGRGPRDLLAARYHMRIAQVRWPSLACAGAHRPPTAPTSDSQVRFRDASWLRSMLVPPIRYAPAERPEPPPCDCMACSLVTCPPRWHLAAAVGPRGALVAARGA
jgi:hypothetical protein